jgi:adenine/guanine/hypoxanthine permease
VVGGINVTESARVAGDDYNTRDILLTEAVATLVAGVTGGVAQSTPYIGQPAYKHMGSRSGYTVLTGVFIGIGGMFGIVSFIVELIPRAVLAPILVFVALDIIVQSFFASPRRHAPAGKSLPELLVTVALGNGFIVTGMLWGGFLAVLIDRKVRTAAVYLCILAVLTFFGVIHSSSPDGLMYLPWTLSGFAREIPYQFASAYALLALVLVALSYTRQAKEPSLAA